eukprot:c39325_g1_i1 orf=2-181(-)
MLDKQKTKKKVKILFFKCLWWDEVGIIQRWLSRYYDWELIPDRFCSNITLLLIGQSMASS